MTLQSRRAATDITSGRGPAQLWRMLLLGLLMALAFVSTVRAQDATFKNEELDQMLAPIALYPDSLLAQVLMASTYPADVAEAVAWSKAHPDDKGDAAIKKVEGQAWEASVKSLVAFPQVLAMMGARPDDVQRLGDAFLADPARVMDRVQFLRKKAQEAGNLKTTEQQKVSTATEENKTVIIVEPAQPQTVYVPVYQPTVYGTWWYPSYPPYYWAPPPYYYPGGAFIGGVIWGAAVVGIANGLWGGCNWGRGDVNINVNRYNNINVNNKISNGNFSHNAARRGDVPYRDSKSREQYGAKQREGAQDREAYRGKDNRDADRARAESALKDRGADPAAGREKLQGADRDRATAAARDTGRTSAGADRAGADRGAGADRAGAANDRSFGGGGSAGGASQRSDFGGSQSAFSGAKNTSASRANADRGQASRSSMSSGAGARSAAAARPSGGARAGGGRR
jgi:hypothetical protein